MKKPDNAAVGPKNSAVTIAKSKSQKTDDSIMGTNNSSIVSKRSVERLYYPNEQFFRHFVKKFQRRSPLINRGYWLRMKAIDTVVRQFLEQTSEKPKIVINLGCGYDPLPWQCLTRYKSHCSGTKFIDIDYRELMLKKRNVVENEDDLKSLLTNVKVSEGPVLLESDQYLQIGCDLRDLASLNRILSSVIDLQNSFVLFTAEVSITYMNVEAADALIAWASKLPQASFCLLEQLVPEGKNHPFAQMMLSHFHKLGTPLGAVEKYPTIAAQESRFQALGWPDVSACNLWKIWSSDDFVTADDRAFLKSVEPFDEWEEFALFGCHYVLVTASTIPTEIIVPKSDTEAPNVVPKSTLPEATNVSFTEHPKGQGCRRFAAALPVVGQQRTADDIGLFGGMGVMTRLNSFDIYTISTQQAQNHPPRSSSRPSSRMCHTITDLGDAGALLVGGRTSPDAALADCWLYHKWLDTWERVDDLPWSLYRHQAVALGCGSVLVTTGKTNSQIISDNYLVWNRRTGWRECVHVEEEREGPYQVYGATFGIISGSGKRSLQHTSGLLSGGLTSDSKIQLKSWIWDIELSHAMECPPIITFKRIHSEAQSEISRFGASVVNHQGKTFVVGGVIRDEMLPLSSEVCSLEIQTDSLSYTAADLKLRPDCPRPLLVGSTAVSTDAGILILGGSAVCFSFGTFLNRGCFTLLPEADLNASNETTVWKYLRTIEPSSQHKTPKISMLESSCGQANIKLLPRLRISSSADFEKLVQAGSPVILEGLDIGSCTTKWTAQYLKDKIGADRQIIVHEATIEHMNFTTKNFAYVPKKFGEFMENIEKGEKLYLRSLSSDKPAEKVADINEDFPTIAEDFRLPPELHMVLANAHSSPLRISGPVNMWLHYDVMANVLCQVKGSKRLFLFPPADFKQFDFEPGASSSPVDVFGRLAGTGIPASHPHEALMQPGDVLFIPPLWLHTASPTSGMSISVNIFFKNLKVGYAAGKDVYGNRDLQAYEKGRQDIRKIMGSFEKLPADIRQFYLQRLLQEFEQKVGQV